MTFFSSYLFLTVSVSFHFIFFSFVSLSFCFLFIFIFFSFCFLFIFFCFVLFCFVLFSFLLFYFYFIFFLQELSLTGLMRENCIMMKLKENSVGKAMKKLKVMRKTEHSSWGKEHWNFYLMFFIAELLFRFTFCNFIFFIIDFQHLSYQYFLSYDDGFSFLWRKWRWDNAWLKIILQCYIM